MVSDPDLALREPEASDLTWMLELNNRHATELSELDPVKMAELARTATHVRVVDDAAALLIAFDSAAQRDSANFTWFAQRFDAFLYVDRVVVAAHARGRGLARRLYADAIAVARSRGLARVVSEVNSEPPNPGSEAFHTACGFEVVGAASLPGGKSVRYWSLELSGR